MSNPTLSLSGPAPGTPEAPALLATAPVPSPLQRDAECTEASRRSRWDTDADAIRGRCFDFGKKFLPDRLSKIGALGFLSAGEARFLSQLQGRTYAKRFALEAPAGLTGDALVHQALFRRLDQVAAERMPPGYRFVPSPEDVANAVLGKSPWAVLALTLGAQLFCLAHYRASIDPDPDLCPLWKDVFLHRWKEASQRAILDELAWRREDARLSAADRERGVADLLALVAAVDASVQRQAQADAGYFLQHAGRAWTPAEAAAVREGLFTAYRWQYIASGMQEPRFAEVLKALVTRAQLRLIGQALAPILE